MRRKSFKFLNCQDQRALNHSVQQQPMLGWIDDWNTCMMTLEMQPTWRNYSFQVL
jgi:hypothetical protein